MANNWTQSDFTGGMQSHLSANKLPEEAYWLGINLRSRNNQLAPIRAPLNLRGPLGKYQMLKSAGPFLVLVASGKAYVKDVRSSADWLLVENFELDANTAEIDACLVPLSSTNFGREGDIDEMKLTNTIVNGSPSGMLVTDGINQPLFIQPTDSGAAARTLQDYSQWVMETAQEYVPKCRFPLVAGRKTYAVMRDENNLFTQIVGSVSGRPLDFVINLNPTLPTPVDEVSPEIAYTFSITITEAPANGEVRINNNTQTAATIVWISNLTLGAFDIAEALTKVKIGDSIHIQSSTDITKWAKYKVTAAPVVKTGFVEFPVLHVASGGNLVAGAAFIRATDVVTQEEIDAIPVAGDKAGDALTVADSFTYDEVVALYPALATQGGFILCTATATWILQQDFQNKIFGEPILQPSYLFSSGSVNNRSFCEINGRTTFISPKGIQSFDLVKQLATESSNLPFAREINRFLDNIQRNSAAITHDDYGFYSVDTIYGPGVAVYDTTSNSWTSIDLYRRVGKIIQFAETLSDGVKRLFAISNENQIYEMFAGDHYETAKFYPRDMSTGKADMAHSIANLDILFGHTLAPFEVSVSHYRDRRIQGIDIQTVSIAESTTHEVQEIPFDEPNDRLYKQVTSRAYSNDPSMTSGFMVEWHDNVSISMIGVTSTPANSTDAKNTALFNTQTRPSKYERYVFISDIYARGPYDQIISNIMKDKPIAVLGGGDFLYQPFNKVIMGHWPEFTDFYVAMGERDVDAFREFMVRFNGKRYFSKRFSDLLEVFFISSGYSLNDVEESRPASREPDGNTFDSRQGQWLRDGLSASTARFKIAVVHQPPWSSAIQDLFKPLRWPFRAWGCDLVLSGHVLNYERLLVNGLTYVVAGTGCRDLSNPKAPIADSVVQVKEYGHVRIDVNSFGITLKFISPDGKQLDVFRIGS